MAKNPYNSKPLKNPFFVSKSNSNKDLFSEDNKMFSDKHFKKGDRVKVNDFDTTGKITGKTLDGTYIVSLRAGKGFRSGDKLVFKKNELTNLTKRKSIFNNKNFKVGDEVTHKLGKGKIIMTNKNKILLKITDGVYKGDVISTEDKKLK